MNVNPSLLSFSKVRIVSRWVARPAVPSAQPHERLVTRATSPGSTLSSTFGAEGRSEVTSSAETTGPFGCRGRAWSIRP